MYQWKSDGMKSPMHSLTYSWNPDPLVLTLQGKLEKDPGVVRAYPAASGPKQYNKPE